MFRPVVFLVIIGFLLGLGVMAGSVVLYQDARAFVASAERVEGTVYGFESRRKSDSERRVQTFYYPQILFQTRDGQVVRFRVSEGSTHPSYKIDDQIGVLYDPNNPSNARIDSWLQRSGGPVLFFLAGLAISIISAYFFYRFSLRALTVFRLRRHGAKAYGRIKAVRQDTQISNNGRHPYYIVAEFEDPKTSDTVSAYSDNLWFNPAKAVEIGQSVSIHYDADDAETNWMDSSQFKTL